MKKLALISILLLVILGITAFTFNWTNQSLKPSDFIHWVENEENGLVQRQEFHDYFFEAKYKPLDYIISIEGRTNDLDESKYTELESELEGLQYVDLNIGSMVQQNNTLSAVTDNQNEYFERLDYFVTYASRDIYMVQGKDTLFPVLYHFERNYGLAPENKLLLGFEQGEENCDRQLCINDQILGVGQVKFIFENEKIKSTPTLKLY